MALIEAYKFEVQEITPSSMDGGYDVKTKKFKPFKTIPETMDLHGLLDAITAAVEAGVVDSKKWVKQIFETKDNFLTFVDNYTYYDEYYKTYDRWYFALMRLVDTRVEEGFVSSQDIADKLKEAAKETGQI